MGRRILVRCALREALERAARLAGGFLTGFVSSKHKGEASNDWGESKQRLGCRGSIG